MYVEKMRNINTVLNPLNYKLGLFSLTSDIILVNWSKIVPTVTDLHFDSHYFKV